ncbi:hypothetical protein LTR28_013619 [Elasticomyces elasticus]|nr:hypothetical protein LTR28_013619 [Elasticomyces elasticus]
MQSFSKRTLSSVSINKRTQASQSPFHTQTAADERAKHALRIELKIHDLIGLLRMQVKEHLEKDDVEALETVRDGLVEVVRANGGGGVGAGRT